MNRRSPTRNGTSADQAAGPIQLPVGRAARLAPVPAAWAWCLAAQLACWPAGAPAQTRPVATGPAPTVNTKPARNLQVVAAQKNAAGQRRVALVIGNNRYRDAPLANPVNDARAMARTLEAQGFEVILQVDATQRDMLAGLREFGNRLKGSGSGLFYFAGHGMQIKGRNFLIPVGADIEREDEVAYQALDAQAVLDKMESAGNGTNLVILDACRNNPFLRSFRSAQQGLAQMDAPVGTMVAFSTAPGSVASDGQGSNGLYTHHLLNTLQQPGLKVEEVFKQVRAAVRRESQGKQVPWESTSLEGDFYFVPPLAPAPAPDPLAALDDALWATVQASTQATELQAYLLRFPQGQHAEAARSRLAGLNAQAALAVQAAQAAQAALAAQAAQATAQLQLDVPALSTAPAPLWLTAGAGGAATAPALVATALPALAALPTLAPPAPVAVQPAAIAQPAAVDLVAALQPSPVDGSSSRDERAIAESNRRIAEIVRWGDEDTDRRPAQPRRNAQGFTEGDRYRWAVLDRMRNEYVGVLFQRIDGVQADGRLLVNEGAVELDAQGHLLTSNDAARGSWERWQPALTPWALLAGKPGDSQPLRGQRTWRDHSGQTRTADYRGSARHAGEEQVTVQAGPFRAVKLEVSVTADLPRDDGARGLQSWRLTYWLAPGLGLPVAWELDERVDGRLERRSRHELTAYDVAASPSRMAAITTGR